MNNIFSNIFTGIAVVACFASCSKDMNLQPPNSTTSDLQYSNVSGYKAVLAKVYGSYALTSSQGTGLSDVNVSGLSDPGTADFVRAYWNLQELTTDEAICAWNDANLQSFHNITWTSSNDLIRFLYARSLFQVAVCNEFIRESTDEKLATRGITGSSADSVKQYRAEARFLRAFQYWVLMDLFKNPPFATEKDQIGAVPPQIQAKELFAYIESELKDIDATLPASHAVAYNRVTKAAAWALLARMYLNAETYLGKGSGKYTDAVTYASKVINDKGFSLKTPYKNLFMSDNDQNNPEVILSIDYDATSAQNYGGTTFLICSAHGNSGDDKANYGIPSGGWLGNRSTKNLPDLFANQSGDKRAIFAGSQAEINDVLDFTQGLSVFKFSNLTSTGQTPYSPNGVLCNTDFPLFRLAEMYLTYAEAVKRGGTGGDDATANTYINNLRERAYGNNSGNNASYSLDDILNERGRELYWEGFRRTDLIRYGKFTTGDYLWPWKGGVKEGKSVDSKYAVFPIPAAEIIANTNLHQNSGY